MASSNNIYILIIISVVSVTGILTCGLIVALKTLEWAKGGRLNACDRIIMVLVISSAGFQCTLTVQTYLDMKQNDVNAVDYFQLILVQLLLWTGNSSLWLTTCLCVFYCVKIVDFNHLLWIRLKLRISKAVPWLLLGSVVGPLVLSIPGYWNLYRDVCPSSAANLTIDSMVPDGKLKWRQPYSLISCILGLLLPVLLDVSSITLILTSLNRHTRRMKENASGFSQPRLEAHFATARMVGALLLVYLLIFLAEVLRLFSRSDIMNVVRWTVFAFFAPAQSIILILGNTKLKKSLWKLLTLFKKLEM